MGIPLKMFRLALVSTIAFGLTFVSGGAETPLETVTHVDLDRYVGKWYEIARYPNRFERECDRNVTAEYTKQPRRILVVNSCLKADGKWKRSEGHAKVEDESTNAKLAVTFFWPFYGQYWVICLGPTTSTPWSENLPESICGY